MGQFTDTEIDIAKSVTGGEQRGVSVCAGV